LAANDARLDEVLRSDRTRAQLGLSALRATTHLGESNQPHDCHVRAQS
jgi:hypothetical protein